jgi:glycosyltransferase involved in cell wall biosynthesis
MTASHDPVIGLYQPYPHTHGGVQSVVLDLARALPVHGFRPLVISPEAGRFTEALAAENLPFIVCDPGPAWHVYGRGAKGLTYLFSPKRAIALAKYWRNLARELARHHVALLHCNDYRGVLMAAPAARWARLPALWHMHGFISSPAANLVASALVPWTVPVSAGMLEYLGLGRRFIGKSQVIYNGVAERVPVETPSSCGHPPVVLAVGTLHPRKGYETLIGAFPQVVARCPEAECWIAGPEFADGTYTRRLLAQIQKLGLQEKVRLLGARRDVDQLMRQCQLLCVPSRVEPFGLVAVEAMLAGKPVVASRTGGLPEIIVDGVTGTLVEARNSNALAKAIVQLLTDPSRSERLGQNGRERARTCFSLERMIESFAAFYRHVLTNKEPARHPAENSPAAPPLQPEPAHWARSES